MTELQSVVASSLWDCVEDVGTAFWQYWQQYRDSLYCCCIKWMGGNPTDAEDALSRAMLKAWEKVQMYEKGEIVNFKAWLTRVTHNLCVDIHRERSRSAHSVENIEVYASSEEQGLVSFEDKPESALETDEKRIVIRRAIANLPTRLRETFILHFYQELSYPEIAQQQDISYQNVCKRISQARKILREELREYFIEEEGADTELSVPPTATESVIGEKSEGNAGVEAIAGETVTLSVAVEEVDSVGDEEAIEVAPSESHTESVSVAATSEGKLEVKSDACRCVEATLCERQSVVILVLPQFDEETGSWGNSCRAVQRVQEKPLVGKVAEEFLLPSPSPILRNDSSVMSGITLFQYFEFIKGSFQIKKSEFISGNRPKYESKFSSLVLRGKTVVLITGDAAIQAAGMTKEHARAFQEIADAFTCIIMSRSVNLDCTGLIEEGYASKGFKVKAKSCNWGPTAGFVLADPRLTKLGPLAEDKEKDEIAKAFKEGAGTTKVVISDLRLKYLLEREKLYSNNANFLNFSNLVNKTPEFYFDCYGIVKYLEGNTEKNFALQFRLKREQVKLKSCNSSLMWAVYYAPGAEGVVWSSNQYQKIKSADQNLIPVLAMTNPTQVESHRGEKNLEEYQRALTGDYDLFAVLPVDADKLTESEKASLQDKCNFYDKNGWDLRYVKIGITNEDAHLLKKENKNLGNITVRLRVLMEGLNSKMQQYDKYNGRNMIHHSDEAGRPFEPELEFPVIAFVPATLKNFFDLKKIVPNADTNYLHNTIFAVPSAPELANLFVAARTKFAVMVNTSWSKALANMKGDAILQGFEVPAWTNAERAQGDEFLVMKFGK
jgi:RNA polymerase sigma factor (sigma-70 family)